jgi:hypothetical protein
MGIFVTDGFSVVLCWTQGSNGGIGTFLSFNQLLNEVDYVMDIIKNVEEDVGLDT